MFDQLIVSGKKNNGAANKAANIKAAPKADKAASKGATVRKATPSASAPRVSSGIVFALSILSRPQRGAALFAHTQAFLDLSGIAAGGAFPRAQCVQVLGSTAVNYHLSKGNFEETSHGIALTAQGYSFFIARNVQPELFEAYKQVMTDGKPNEKANVKAANGVVKL